MDGYVDVGADWRTNVREGRLHADTILPIARLHIRSDNASTTRIVRQKSRDRTAHAGLGQ
jgi:hypothetical protein